MNRLSVVVFGASVFCAAAVCADVPEGWTGHDLSTGALTAEDGGRHYVTGSGNVISVPEDVECDIALDGVTISQPAGTSPFVIGDGATVRLSLYNTSSLTASDGYSGVELGVGGASLTVSDGNGKLLVTGGIAGCGICVREGASFTMDAENATVKATSGKKNKVKGFIESSTSGAGVGSRGGDDSGVITINAGRLEAVGTAQAAGIGAGTSDADGAGDCGDVFVHGGTVIAMSKSWGCGIGGGTPYRDVGGNLKNYTQTGGNVTAVGQNCSALGGATGGMRMSTGSLDPHGGSVLGKISISGGKLTATNSFQGAAPAIAPAIGGGGTRYNNEEAKIRTESTSGGEIIVSGGCVIAIGHYIGIGSGGMSTHAPQATHNGGKTSLTITDGTVYVSTTGAADSLWAIGGPEQAGSAVTNLTSVTVTGGNMGVRYGGIQVHPTNGEALGGRLLYPVKTYNNDKHQYVSAGENGGEYEYKSGAELARKPDDSWTYAIGYGTKWLPRGCHRLLDANEMEMFIDVSPADREPMVYDISDLKTTRVSSSTQNMVITGVYNIVNSELKKNSYIAGVTYSGEMKVTFRDVTCINSNYTVYVGNRNKLTVVLEGTNQLRALSREHKSVNSPLHVPDTSELVIDGEGTLIAEALDYTAAIGAGGGANCGDITINGGTIYAYGGMQGAGIGCGITYSKAGNCGDVTINGGVVRAYGVRFNASGICDMNTGWAAGIGGATGRGCRGGNLKSYTQTGGDVEAYGNSAAGIGGGGSGFVENNLNGGTCGPVKITGGRLVADSVTYSHSGDGCVGAGIGGGGLRRPANATTSIGSAGALAAYEQTGGDVTVRGRYIGIGTGGCVTEGQSVPVLDASTSVKVSGGTLTVEGSSYAIGGMETNNSETISLKTVEITGGSVKLIGGIQVAPSNAVGQAVYPAPTYMRRITGGTPPVDVTISVPGTPSYTYAYAGSGHANDTLLYFWLPNGRYSIGDTAGDMVGGVWHRLNGLSIVVR